MHRLLIRRCLFCLQVKWVGGQPTSTNTNKSHPQRQSKSWVHYILFMVKRGLSLFLSLLCNYGLCAALKEMHYNTLVVGPIPPRNLLGSVRADSAKECIIIPQQGPFHLGTCQVQWRADSAKECIIIPQQAHFTQEHVRFSEG